MKVFFRSTGPCTWTALKTYLITIALFSFGVMIFVVLGPVWIRIYSGVALAMQIMVMYSCVARAARRELRTEYDEQRLERPGVAKGFVCGFMAMIPIALLMLLADVFLPHSSDWSVAPDIAGLVEVLLSYGGYFYYGPYNGVWIRMTALIIPAVITGAAYAAAIRDFDADLWVDEHILGRKRQETKETGYEYIQRTKDKK